MIKGILRIFPLLLIALTGSISVQAGVTTTTYTYDANSNRTAETQTIDGSQTKNQTYSYNSRNQLTDITNNLDLLNSTAYTYDANGNRINQKVGGGNTQYIYNANNQLVNVIEQGVSLGQFSYDHQGMRLQKIGERGTENYVYDDKSVIYQTDSTDTLTAKFNYGPYQLLSLTENSDAPQYYLFDALGSPITLTKTSGEVTARYSYDAFGNKLLNTGNSFNRFGFTGHEEDRETDLVYMKARFYDPSCGCFLTEDNFGGFPDTPPSLNKYLYAYANPTMYVDPDGNIVFVAIGAYLAVTAISSAIDTASEVAINEGVNKYTGEASDTTLGGTASLFGETFVTNAVTANLGGKLKKIKVFAKAADKINQFNKKAKALTRSKQSNSQVAPDIKVDKPSQSKVATESSNDAGIDLTPSGTRRNSSGSLVKEPSLEGSAKVTKSVANPVPKNLARVVPGNVNPKTLGKTDDVFVTDANALKGLNSNQIADKLTIPQSSSGFKVIEFPSSNVSGIASPINRTNPGFAQGGRTAGDAPEFVIPNGPLPAGSTTRVVQ